MASNCNKCGMLVRYERYLGRDYWVDIDGNDYCPTFGLCAHDGTETQKVEDDQ